MPRREGQPLDEDVLHGEHPPTCAKVPEERGRGGRSPISDDGWTREAGVRNGRRTWGSGLELMNRYLLQQFGCRVVENPVNHLLRDGRQIERVDWMRPNSHGQYGHDCIAARTYLCCGCRILRTDGTERLEEVREIDEREPRVTRCNLVLLLPLLDLRDDVGQELDRLLRRVVERQVRRPSVPCDRVVHPNDVPDERRRESSGRIRNRHALPQEAPCVRGHRDAPLG